MKVPVVTVVTDIFIKTSSDSSVSSGLIESRYRNIDLIYCSETGDNKDCSDSINSNGSNDIIVRQVTIRIAVTVLTVMAVMIL